MRRTTVEAGRTRPVEDERRTAGTGARSGGRPRRAKATWEALDGVENDTGVSSRNREKGVAHRDDLDERTVISIRATGKMRRKDPGSPRK